MGFARDLGATMTFGLSVTTKHKEAETQVRKPPETTRGALECLQRDPSTGPVQPRGYGRPLRRGSRNPAVHRRIDIRRQQQRNLRMVQTSGRS